MPDINNRSFVPRMDVAQAILNTDDTLDSDIYTPIFTPTFGEVKASAGYMSRHTYQDATIASDFLKKKSMSEKYNTQLSATDVNKRLAPYKIKPNKSLTEGEVRFLEDEHARRTYYEGLIDYYSKSGNMDFGKTISLFGTDLVNSVGVSDVALMFATEGVGALSKIPNAVRIAAAAGKYLEAAELAKASRVLTLAPKIGRNIELSKTLPLSTRVGISALEGAAGNALLEPLVYGNAKNNYYNYGIRDSLTNIVIGAGIGAGGRLVTDGAIKPAWSKLTVPVKKRILENRIDKAVKVITSNPDADDEIVNNAMSVLRESKKELDILNSKSPDKAGFESTLTEGKLGNTSDVVRNIALGDDTMSGMVMDIINNLYKGYRTNFSRWLDNDNNHRLTSLDFSQIEDVGNLKVKKLDNGRYQAFYEVTDASGKTTVDSGILGSVIITDKSPDQAMQKLHDIYYMNLKEDSSLRSDYNKLYGPTDEDELNKSRFGKLSDLLDSLYSGNYKSKDPDLGSEAYDLYTKDLVDDLYNDGNYKKAKDKFLEGYPDSDYPESEDAINSLLQAKNVESEKIDTFIKSVIKDINDSNSSVLHEDMEELLNLFDAMDARSRLGKQSIDDILRESNSLNTSGAYLDGTFRDPSYETHEGVPNYQNLEITDKQITRQVSNNDLKNTVESLSSDLDLLNSSSENLDNYIASPHKMFVNIQKEISSVDAKISNLHNIAIEMSQALSDPSVLDALYTPSKDVSTRDLLKNTLSPVLKKYGFSDKYSSEVVDSLLNNLDPANSPAKNLVSLSEKEIKNKSSLIEFLKSQVEELKKQKAKLLNKDTVAPNSTKNSDYYSAHINTKKENAISYIKEVSDALKGAKEDIDAIKDEYTKKLLSFLNDNPEFKKINKQVRKLVPDTKFNDYVDNENLLAKLKELKDEDIHKITKSDISKNDFISEVENVKGQYEQSIAKFNSESSEYNKRVYTDLYKKYPTVEVAINKLRMLGYDYRVYDVIVNPEKIMSDISKEITPVSKEITPVSKEKVPANSAPTELNLPDENYYLGELDESTGIRQVGWKEDQNARGRGIGIPAKAYKIIKDGAPYKESKEAFIKSLTDIDKRYFNDKVNIDNVFDEAWSVLSKEEKANNYSAVDNTDTSTDIPSAGIRVATATIDSNIEKLASKIEELSASESGIPFSSIASPLTDALLSMEHSLLKDKQRLLLSASVRQELFKNMTTIMPNRPAEYLSSILSNSYFNFYGAKAGIETLQKRLGSIYNSNIEAPLKKANLWNYYKMPSYQKDIRAALLCIEKYGSDEAKYPVQLDPTAKTIAQIISKTYKGMVNDLNSAGADLTKLGVSLKLDISKLYRASDILTPSSTNTSAMHLVSRKAKSLNFENNVKTIVGYLLPKLDMQKTFFTSDKKIAYSKLTDMVRDIMKDGYDVTSDFRSRSLRGINDSSDRFVFSSFEDELDVLNTLGRDTVDDQVSRDLRKAHNNLCVMSKLGPDPYRTFYDLIDLANEYHVKNGSTGHSIGKTTRLLLEAHFKNVDGSIDNPGAGLLSFTWNLVGTVTGFKLGKTAVRSLTDFVNASNVLIHNGLVENGFDAAKLFKDFVPYAGTKLGKEFGESLGLYSDVVRSEILRAGNIADVAEGFLNGANRFFLKMSGIEFQTTITQRAMAAVCSHTMSLSSNLEKKSLSKNLQSSLDGYAIDDTIWNAIRKLGYTSEKEYASSHGFESTKDRSFITPEKIMDASIDDLRKVFGDMSEDKLVAMQKEAAGKLSSMLIDAANEATNMPTARVRKWTNFGTSSDSWGGFATRTITRFKAFPLAMYQQNYARLLLKSVNPNDSRSIRELLTVGGGLLSKDLIGFIASYASSAMVIGGLIDILSGKTPIMPVTEDGEVNQAFFGRLTNEILPIAGDIITSQLDRHNNRPTEQSIQSIMMGPTLTDFYRSADYYSNAFKNDKDPDEKVQMLGARILENALKSTPVSNLFWTELGFKILLLDKVHQMAKPDSYDRESKKLDYTGQEYLYDRDNPKWLGIIE